MKLLISTNKPDLDYLYEKIKDVGPKVEIIIISQYSNERSQHGRLCELENVKIIDSNTFGLSKSRNIAIKYCKNDICLFGDDDAEYIEGFDQQIEAAFMQNPKASIITFQIRTPDGVFFKKYKSVQFKHTLLSILKVSSIELAFNGLAVRESKILFDERFGLGSKYEAGEEVIFLSDCIKKGLKAIYCPKSIVIHKYESSGKSVNDRQYSFVRGAMFYRIYGLKGLVLLLFMGFRKKIAHRDKIGLRQFLISGIKGYKSIKRDS